MNPEPTTPSTPTPTTTAQHAPILAALVADVQSGAITQAQFDKKVSELHSASSAPSSPAGSPDPTTAAGPASVLDAANQWGDREKAMIRQDLDAALADGRITQKQYDDDLKLAGLEPTSLDTRRPEAKEIDKAFPPAKPADFMFPTYGDHPGQEAHMTPEMRAFDTEARAALAYARFPRELGSSFAKEVNRVAGECKNMSPAERELYYRSQAKILQDIWKGDAYAKNLSMANQLFRELAEKYPRLARIMMQSGAGSSARVVALLYQQAERLSQRRSE